MEIKQLKISSKIFLQILKISYHILRYYNLIKPKYNSSEIINFGQKETGEFLKTKIKNSNVFRIWFR